MQGLYSDERVVPHDASRRLISRNQIAARGIEGTRRSPWLTFRPPIASYPSRTWPTISRYLDSLSIGAYRSQDCLGNETNARH